MKPQLIIFAILIAGFIVYNFFFQFRMTEQYSSEHHFCKYSFGYIAFMAYSLLKNEEIIVIFIDSKL
jgi:hypothetical protein